MRRFSKTISKDANIGKRLARLEDKVSRLKDNRYALTNVRLVPVSSISIYHLGELGIQYELDGTLYTESDSRFVSLEESPEYNWIYKSAIGDILQEWCPDYSNESIFTVLRLKMFMMLSEEMSGFSNRILNSVMLGYYPGYTYEEMRSDFGTILYRYVPRILGETPTTITMHHYNKHDSGEETYSDNRKKEFVKLYNLWITFRDDLMYGFGIEPDLEDYSVDEAEEQ